MLCKICCEGLQGIWDLSTTSSTKRIGKIKDLKQAGGLSDIPLPPEMPDDPQNSDPRHCVFGHHLTSQSLEQSAHDGCTVCHSLGSSGEGMEPEWTFSEFGYHSLFTVTPYHATADITLYTMVVYAPGSSIQKLLYRYTGPIENLNTDISPSTGDETTWNLIQGWMKACVLTHVRCNRPRTFVPRRLLRLETDGFFRLVQGNEVEPGAQYSTLSYCHSADDTSLQLTEASFEQLVSAQSLSILPSMYSDAFSVISRLGLRYLWIDRLCVLQDSHSDQAAHGSQIQDIFSNSYCGIGAASSTSSTTGLFVKREPDLVISSAFDFHVDAHGSVVPHLATVDKHVKRFEDEPLAQSVRVVQERLLTPRMLHFSSDLVYWECHGAICNEYHPQTILKSPLYTGVEGEKTTDGRAISYICKPLHDVLIRHVEDPINEVFVRWLRIVEMYSKCSTTSPDEKLLGLKKLALDLSVLLRERGLEDTSYLAGMWKALLPGGLLWNVREGGSRPVKYRAPSWSWAAIDGRINLSSSWVGDLNNGLLCDFISAACTTDDFGAVTEGTIVIKGTVCIGKLSPTTALPTIPETDTIMNIKTLMDPNSGSSLAEAPGSKRGHHWCVSFDTIQDIREEIFCLPINVRFDDTTKFYRVGGLALSKLDCGSYVRCGIWHITTNTEEEGRAIFKSKWESELTIL